MDMNPGVGSSGAVLEMKPMLRFNIGQLFEHTRKIYKEKVCDIEAISARVDDLCDMVDALLAKYVFLFIIYFSLQDTLFILIFFVFLVVKISPK